MKERVINKTEKDLGGFAREDAYKVRITPDFSEICTKHIFARATPREINNPDDYPNVAPRGDHDVKEVFLSGEKLKKLKPTKLGRSDYPIMKDFLVTIRGEEVFVTHSNLSETAVTRESLTNGYTMEIERVFPQKSPKMEITLSVNYLLDILKLLKGDNVDRCKISLWGEDQVAKIAGEGGENKLEVGLMPMRIK